MSFEGLQPNDAVQNAGGNAHGQPEASSQQAAQVIEIQNWLVKRLAELIKVSPEEVDIQEPFANFGLNSIDAVSLSGDLEDLLRCRLSATLLWDFPTIETLSHHLAGESAVVQLPE
ncbi:MAG TPA: acyl carrier protein [Pyrinomonadaceae bacterium]|nr:acyl carrier protein [Pyrinomonadaceae bacterium]